MIKAGFQHVHTRAFLLETDARAGWLSKLQRSSTDLVSADLPRASNLNYHSEWL